MKFSILLIVYSPYHQLTINYFPEHIHVELQHTSPHILHEDRVWQAAVGQVGQEGVVALRERVRHSLCGRVVALQQSEQATGHTIF